MHSDREKKEGSSITVLAHLDRISLCYSLYPFLADPTLRSRMRIVQSVEKCGADDKNNTLLILRYFRNVDVADKEAGVDVSVLEDLRSHYDRIVFFDDGDAAGDTRFEVLPYVDAYLKKQYYRDLSIYERRLYGRNLYTDYYYRTHDVRDDRAYYRSRLDAQYSEKLYLAWNLGVGMYPLRPLQQRIGVAFARVGFVNTGFRIAGKRSEMPCSGSKKNQVHARFGHPDRPTIRFQRELIESRIDSEPGVLSGRVPKKQYERELRASSIVLSPFGWGEICFRDFEAIRNGAALMKPDMSSVITYPDVFKENETYIPIRWDGSDVHEQIQRYRDDEKACQRIAESAMLKYKDEVDRIEKTAWQTFQWIIGDHTEGAQEMQCLEHLIK